MEKKNKEDAILQKSDLDTIIKVNNRAIELQTEISEQYEEIISYMGKVSEKQEKLIEDIKEIKKEIYEINKSQFKLILLLSSGIVSLIIQVLVLLKK